MAVSDTEGDVRGRASSIPQTIFESTSLKISVLGVCFWLVAIALWSGVWPAILAIWGTALIVVGLVIYGVVWWTHQ